MTRKTAVDRAREQLEKVGYIRSERPSRYSSQDITSEPNFSDATVKALRAQGVRLFWRMYRLYPVPDDFVTRDYTTEIPIGWDYIAWDGEIKTAERVITNQAEIRYVRPPAPVVDLPECEADGEAPSLPADFWAIEALQSTDELKRDLELTCTVCHEHLCDIEPSDNIAVLYITAARHIQESHS